MKKSILAIAVVAATAAPAVMAAPTVYGNLHVSISDQDSKKDIDMQSNTSAFGVKGSEDLGDGMKAIYKAEFQVDVAEGGSANDKTDEGSNGNALTQRDVWAGIKGGMGTLKLGTMSSNWKQKGGKVDSLYRTRLEGRGILHTQSRLHSGRAVNRGRMTNQVQYASPKMGGFQLVANTTFSNSSDETLGAGIRYKTKAILAYVDWIDTVPGGASSKSTTSTQSAVKVGGKYKTKSFHIAAQYEDADNVTGYNYIHVNGGFNINKNNSIQATFGSASLKGPSTTKFDDTTSFALAYNHKLSKMTNVYVGYGDVSADSSQDDSIITLGFKKKF